MEAAERRIAEGLEEDWRRTGGGLEKEAGRRTAGGLEEDWRRTGRGLTTVWDPRCASTFIVDAHLGPQKPAQCMFFTTLGAKMRINIYVDARFYAPKASEDMILTTFGAQHAHQHRC